VSLVQPASTAELATLIRGAARDRTRVLVVGGGTHGACPATEDGRRISLAGRLRSVVTYDPAELVVTVDAGLAVEELDATLAEHGQEWCADIVRGSTVGGSIAAGASSLRRRSIGPLRDSVLGLELVDGRGRLIRVGGRTVKNSTGLDLVRLMVGSRGTLGVITRAHLRVRPRPRSRAVVRAGGASLAAAIIAARQASVVAAAIADSSTVQLLLEGWPDDVAADAAMLVEHLGGELDARPGSFPQVRSWARWPAVAMLTVRPSAVETLLGRAGTRWATQLFGGHVWIGGDTVSELVPSCATATERGGHATLISEPGWPTWPAASAGNDTRIGERVKAAFDPDGAFPRLARWSPA